MYACIVYAQLVSVEEPLIMSVPLPYVQVELAGGVGVDCCWCGPLAGGCHWDNHLYWTQTNL